MNVGPLLALLSGVRQTGPDRWIARCPAHEDRTPSLAVRELDDGRILVHDFGGCDIDDVLAAVGLTLADLYPTPLRNPDRESGNFPRERRSFDPLDALRIVARECVICVLAASDAATGKPLSEADTRRCAVAAARILQALDAVTA